MKQTKSIALLLIGLPVLIFLIVLWSPWSAVERTPVLEEGDLIYESTDEDLGVDISIELSEHASINTWVIATLQRIENDYRAALEGVDVEGMIQSPILDADLSLSDWGGYQSAVLSVYEYTGGAHGYPYVVTAVTSVQADTLVGLSDVMGQEDYLKPLSRLMLGRVSDLHEVFDGDTIRDSLAPSATNYENWSIGPDGVIFYFNPYVIAPYAAGIIDVLVTWDEIENF